MVGGEHANYQANLALAEKISTKMNQLVPNISRGIMLKQGAGVNGIYNQDLANNMLLIELGGIENMEEELLRTVAIIAQAMEEFSVKEQI